MSMLGTVSIVGFPNVGKSTLVNRLTGSRAAVVHETSGVTRDRKELVCEWGGNRFLLIDTGGVDIADLSPMTRSIRKQAEEAVAEADLVLFVVDARAGVTPGDEEVADILRRSRKPVLRRLVTNRRRHYGRLITKHLPEIIEFVERAPAGRAVTEVLTDVELLGDTQFAIAEGRQLLLDGRTGIQAGHCCSSARSSWRARASRDLTVPTATFSEYPISS